SCLSNSITIAALGSVFNSAHHGVFFVEVESTHMKTREVEHPTIHSGHTSVTRSEKSSELPVINFASSALL
ncbi:hypothetical protein F8388_005420, partial [Cannabis sativa]